MAVRPAGVLATAYDRLGGLGQVADGLDVAAVPVGPEPSERRRLGAEEGGGRAGPVVLGRLPVFGVWQENAVVAGARRVAVRGSPEPAADDPRGSG
ncbi:hypothetical protein GCM10023083_62840 [Streptomyces phyllanthi]